MPPKEPSPDVEEPVIEEGNEVSFSLEIKVVLKPPKIEKKEVEDDENEEVQNIEVPYLQEPYFRYSLGGKIQDNDDGSTEHLEPPLSGVTASVEEWQENEELGEDGSETKGFIFNVDLPKLQFSKKRLIELNNFPLLVVSLADKMEGESATALSEERIGRNFLYQYTADISQFFSSTDCVNISRIFNVDDNIPGIDHAEITLTADQPLLTAELKQELNPMSIYLKDIQNFPGIRRQEIDIYDNYEMLKTYCKPVQASITLFPEPTNYIPPKNKVQKKQPTTEITDMTEVSDDFGKEENEFTDEINSIPSSTVIRIVTTEGIPHQKKIKFGHKVSVLTGHLDQMKLAHILKNNGIMIKIHDRLPYKGELREETVVALKEAFLVGKANLNLQNGVLVEQENPGEQENPDLEETDELEEEEPDPYILRRPESEIIADIHLVQADFTKLVTEYRNYPHGYVKVPVEDFVTDDPSKNSYESSFGKYSRLQGKIKIKERFSVMPQRRQAPEETIDTIEIPHPSEEIAFRENMEIQTSVGEYLPHATDLGVEIIIDRRICAIPSLSEEKDNTTNFAEEENEEIDNSEVQDEVDNEAIRDDEKLSKSEDIVDENLKPKIFTHVAYIFEYKNNDLLTKLTSAIDEINEKAFPNAVGSMKTYQLSEEEIEASQKGDLDVICGFMIIDHDCRLVVLEGKEDGGIGEVLKKVPRTKRNDEGYRVLSNPDLCSKERLYTGFDVDLKRIRLRDSLSILVQSPDLYSGKASDVVKNMGVTLESLYRLRSCKRYREILLYKFLPSTEQLELLENLYGETVTKEDIWGDKIPQRIPKNNRLSCSGNEAEFQGTAAELDTEHVSKKRQSTKKRITSEGESANQRRKAPTDSKNPEYLEALAEWKPKDYLAIRKTEGIHAAKLIKDYLEKRKCEEEKDRIDPTYQYGSQKLQYTELKKRQMQQILGKKRSSYFTYSEQYSSLAFPMVDPFRIQQLAEEESKAAWLTKEGFVFPAPRTRKELITHPQRPSDQRISDLKYEWDDPHRNKNVESKEPTILALERGFKTQVPTGIIFGGYHKPEWKRDYDGRCLGNYSRLPRGRIQNVKNPEFYKSVHLFGEKQMKLMEAAIQKEKEDWARKVAVDDTTFYTVNMVVKDVPHQGDRTKDILQGPAKKLALRKVRRSKLPSGKVCPLESLPINVQALEPYVEPFDSLKLREDSSDPLLDYDGSERKKFDIRVHPDRMKPKCETLFCRKKAPEIKWEEKHGALYDFDPVKESTCPEGNIKLPVIV